MPNFDISRIGFDALKHYSGVRMQQGRVLTDDDWNENERIAAEEYRRTQVDIIGPTGSPDNGFKIERLDTTSGFIDFDIDAGTLYTGGIRFQMDSTERFRSQKDWIEKKDNEPGMPVQADFPGGLNELFDLVYFEGWQQPVCAVEDYSLFEPALGGPDTTTRQRNMRRVKIFRNTGTDKCHLSWNKLKTDWQNAHFGIINDENELLPDTKLQVGFIAATPGDLCSPSVLGGYLGAENQAIRVQVTRVDRAINKGFFTWGFDNAAPLYRVSVNGTKVVMITEPKDQYHWPLSGQVVEILPWSAVLSNNEKIAGQKGAIRKVQISYNPDSRSFDLDAAITASDLPLTAFFYMRVWNRGDDLLSTAEIPFTPGLPVSIGSTGLQVTFSGNDFIAPDGTGNVWVIAARPGAANPGITPFELTTTGVHPHGVRFFYSPLAVIKWTKAGENISGEIIHDCRKTFEPLTEDCCSCITVKPVPGWESVFERYRDRQDICICFKNGVYELDKPVIISNKGNIKFTGCGSGSKIISHNSESAFAFIDCRDITIRDLSVKNDFVKHPEKNLWNLQGVIDIKGCRNILFENIAVACKRLEKAPVRQQTCITVNAKGLKKEKSSTRVSVQQSRFDIDTAQTGLLIIDAAKTDIEGNMLNGTLANQGIVVAGVSPQNTCIRNNIIKNVFQGIHVGASNSKLYGEKTTLAGTVIISGNNIECLLTATYKRERHGIFAGNCNSLVMNENFIRLVRIKDSDKKDYPGINGIRIFGRFGKRIIVRDNHLEGFGYFVERKKRVRNIGLLIHYLKGENEPRWWIVEANVTEVLSIEGPGRLFRTPKMTFADRRRSL